MQNIQLFPLIGMLVCLVWLPEAQAQYMNPYGYQQQPQLFLQQPSQLEIEAYLNAQNVHGVRPSRAAYVAVKSFGDSAKAIINRYGEDGLAALGSVSGISASALRDLIPELNKVRQVYTLLRLIAQHPEPDRIVELLEIYRQDLGNSPFIDVLLKQPNAVLELGPLVRMSEIVALNQESQSPASAFERAAEWFGASGAANSEVDAEKRSKQIADALLIGVVCAVFGAVFWQLRKKLLGFKAAAKIKSNGPPPRIEYSPSRPKPAFMVQRDRNNGL